jgi:hypothetical protein
VEDAALDGRDLADVDAVLGGSGLGRQATHAIDAAVCLPSPGSTAALGPSYSDLASEQESPEERPRSRPESKPRR